MLLTTDYVAFSLFLVVYTVMKCLLEAHDSNPARFDRECLLHLTSRMRMWELAAKVRLYTLMPSKEKCSRQNQKKGTCLRESF